jgi:hypothetical protein
MRWLTGLRVLGRGYVDCELLIVVIPLCMKRTIWGRVVRITLYTHPSAMIEVLGLSILHLRTLISLHILANTINFPLSPFPFVGTLNLSNPLGQSRPH